MAPLWTVFLSCPQAEFSSQTHELGPIICEFGWPKPVYLKLLNSNYFDESVDMQNSAPSPWWRPILDKTPCLLP